MRKPRARPPRRPRLLAEELEPRILYSADAAALLGLNSGPGSALVRELEPVPLPARLAEVQQPTAASAESHGAREIVFIDSRVPDAMTLADELMQQRGGERQFDIVVLAADEDGIAQINRVLASEHELAAIHIVSHGGSAAIEVGNTRLDAARLAVDAESVARWGLALGADGDLLLYGCDVAQGDAGQAFVQSLAALTGADVAASSDATGAASLGGDWTLEAQSGRIETLKALAPQLELRWNGLLSLASQGGETLVNSGGTTGSQITTPYGGGNVAMDSSGNYVIVFTDQNVNSGDVYAQRYNASGVAQGAAILVNGSTADVQSEPSVAMAADGRFVVSWSSFAQDAAGGWGVYARQYAADGTASGAEFKVNTNVTGDQRYSKVGMDAAGNFVVAFADENVNTDVYAQRYNAAGVAQGSNFRVNSTVANIQSYPDIDVHASSGDFIIVWESNLQDGSGNGVYGQRYNAAGAAQGGEFQLHTSTADLQESAKVAYAPDRSFAVAWESGASNIDFIVRRFDANGNALTGEITANTTTANTQRWGNLAFNDNGNLIVTWGSNLQDGSGSGIYAQQFDATTGAKVGSELRVSTSTTNAQEYPSVAASGSKAVIVWGGNGTVAGNTDSAGVFMQRLNVSGITITPATGLLTTEAGGSAQFNVVLLSAPTANVTIAVNSSDLTEGTVSTSLLTFTTGNWSTPQTVTVTGVNDALADAYQRYSVVLGPASSSDGNYSGLTPASVAVSNRDDDLNYGLIEVTTTSDSADGDTSSLTALDTNRGADGQVSLREAITAANNTANGAGGADRIHFNIAGSGVHTIAPTAALPTITGQVVIDASTDDSFAANGNRPAIILEGTNAGAGTDGLVLTSTADGSVIRGLVIRDFGNDGIVIQAGSDNNVIAGNYIGRLTATGTDAGAGTENADDGIEVLGSNNTIGGTVAADRNVISGNASTGINLEDASGNTVAGNYIGLTAAGTAVLGNGNDGVLIRNGASGNTIGGATPAHRNVIAGNNDGVQIGGTGVGANDNNVVIGNYIGTDVTGTVDLGNTDDGVDIDDASLNNQILNNLIAGNTSDGIDLAGAGTPTGTVIQGNLIGTAANGSSPLGNSGHGIRIGTSGTAYSTTIGGTAGGQGNTIAFNARDGIFVDVTSTSVAILGNSIYGNTEQGVDLGAGGVAANDAGDADAGANNLQNFPVLASANADAAGTTIVGTINSNANTSLRIEFYANRPSIADALNGEGERYLGFIIVTTDGSGNASLNTTLANVWVNSGDRISATATVDLGGGSYGSTSEFAANVTATSVGIIVVDTTSDTYDSGVASGSVTIGTLGNNRGADGRISLREAINAANNTANGPFTDKIVFNIAGAGPHVINVASALPTIGQALIIDGLSEPDYVAGTPVVRIDGAAAGFSGISVGAGGGGSTIQGLMVTGFTVHGINVASGANNVVIADNWIGTAGNGTTGNGNSGVGNSDDGIAIAGSNASITRNVITNSGDEGIDIVGSGVTAHVIQGNIIGLDPDGATGGGNHDVGIAIMSGSGNTIGGTTVAARNVISMNWDGLEINTSNNVLQGNYIGTDVTGTLPRGNRLASGVLMPSAASNNQIGGTAAGAGNLIAFNALNGVKITNGSGVAILGNLIHSNTGLGVDLGTAGVTANDALDADTGANNLQNFPVLASANADAAGTTIVGSINSNANTSLRIEFYANRPSIADALNGEGERYLGFIIVTTDVSGNASLNTTLANVWVNSGDRISATATVDLGGGNYGSTSEFAANVTATSIGIIVVDTTGDSYDSGVASGSVTIGTLGNNRGADGRISLREAMFAANNTANGGTPDKIVFNIAGAGPHVINVASALPTIGQALIIDASTDDSFAANGNRPAIVLDGNDGNFAGLEIGATGDGSTIKGLVIRDFGTYGLHIAVNSDGNTIVGNYIGALSAGGVSAGAGENNGDAGIYVQGSNNTIGGASPALRNVISGNNSDGIRVLNASGNTIQGNFIGTDAAGTTLIGNLGEGIELRGATNTQIGGTAASAGNVLAGAEWEGIWLWEGTTGTVVEGNFIGTDITGTLNLGNAASGINIGNFGPPSTGNRIGGTAAGAANLIAFNGRSGVEVDQNSGGASTGNPILGNRFHANAGIAIDLDGFDADPSSAGVTANDAGDADVGGNNRQNFPVLTAAATTGTQVTFTGTLNSTASTQFRIEFFASTAQDGSGYGEGERYLGFVNVTTDGSGNATISDTLTATVAAGEFISATATKSNAGFTTFTDTSEFAASLVVSSSMFQQGTGSYSGTEDTELDSGAPNSNLGADVTIDVDFTGVGTENQALILFNGIFGTGTGQIPVGSTIVSASLRLYASGGTFDTISAHRMLVSWSEASTWNSLTAGAQTNGTEAEVAADGTYAGTGATGVITITGLEQSLQAWSSGATNFGWVLRNSGTDGLQFDSSEAAVVAQRPQLIVEYTPPSSAPTIANLSGDTLAYSEGDGAVVIEQGGNATVSDADSANFNSGTLTVSFAAGSDSAEDVLSIRNQGMAAGEIGVSGSNVSFGGVTIGTFTGGSGGANLVVTFNASATPAAAEALVRNVAFQNTDTDAPTTGARTVRFVLTDGDGGTSANQDATVTVSGVNDAPNATNLSTAESYTEDTALNLTDIVVSDVDSASVTATLTLSNSAAGSLNTGTSGTVTSTYNAGIGVWSASGAIIDVNALLAGLTFTPASNFNSNFTITTSVSDGVATPVTGSKAMTGIAANDAPSATNLSAAESYTEDTALNLTDIVGSDVDSASVTTTLTLSNSAAGSLNTGTSGAVTSTYNTGTGVWTASGAIADVNTLLAGLTFTPATNFNSNFTIATSVSDGVAAPVTGSKAMTGTAVNDAPSASNLSAAETYTEDTALNLTGIVIGDVDSADVTATLTLSNTAAGSLNTGTSGSVTSTYNAGTGVWAASGALADVNALLAGLIFTPAADFNSAFTIATSVGDGVAAPVTGAKAMTGTAVSEAPVNTVPGSQTLNEDASLVYSSGNGNAVTVSDGSASDLRVQVTLTVTQGILTLAGTTGLTFVSGSNGGATMVIDGLESAINAAMNGMTYSPTANYDGSANLQVTTAQAAGLVGHYTFDAATAEDSSAGTAHNGSFVGNATTVVDGTRGSVLALDGAGDSVQIAGTFGNPTEITLGAWVNFSGAGRQDLISLNDRVHIALDDGGQGVKGAVQIGAASWIDLASNISLSGTGWHQVTYSYSDSGNVHALYIDGVQVASAVNNSSIYWTGATTTYIGQHPTLGHYVNGRVDDARIYTRALSAGEVADIVAEWPNDTDNVAITVSAVNDAPTLGDGTLAAVAEDTTSPAGQAVGTIFSAQFADVDTGSSLVGIAVVGNTANAGTQGSWQYSSNGGSNWFAIGTVADDNTALAISSSTLVRFVPVANYSGTPPALTVRGLDNSYAAGFSSTAGSETRVSVDTTTNGGSTAIAAASASLSTSITAMNNAPAIANLGGDALGYAEGDGAVVIEQGGNATVTDVDSVDFNTGTLTIYFAAGSDSAEDVLAIRNEGSGAGQIGVSGANVTYGGATIGSFSGGSGGADLAVSFTGLSSPVAAQALIRNITYQNTDTNAPTTGARTVRFVLTDGDGGTSANADTSVTVSGVNDAPVAADDRLALNFDGVDDYVTISDSPSLVMSSTMTLEAWINPDLSGNAVQIIANKEGEYELGVFADGSLNFAFAEGGTWNWRDTGATIARNTWTHVAVTYDAGAVTTYVNGAAVNSQTLATTTIDDVYPALNELRIGGRSTNPANQYFDGRIAEVRVWNVVRSLGQIAGAMNSPLTGAEAGLAGYWALNESSGATVADGTANGNNGGLVNGVTWVGYRIDEDTTLTAAVPGVLANDDDVDGDPLSAVLVSGPANGSLTLNANGSFIYTPNANWNGTDSFTYKANDGTADSNVATVRVVVNPVSDTPTGAPVVTGTATEDQVLSASTATIADGDGLGAFGYQWQRNGVNIAGATASTFTLGDTDVGTGIRVVVSYTDGNGTAESLTSAAVGPVANVNDAPSGSVTVDDTTPTQGQTLTASNTLADADGLGSITYQWQRGGVNIAGATASTYTTTPSDVGSVLRVVASYTDALGTAESVASADTAAVANVNDAPVGGPTITGTVSEDQTLSANTAGISDADGLGAFGYQWLRNGGAIGGATASTYTLGDADVGTLISVRVDYTDAQGTAEGPLTSVQTAAVTNVNDVPTGSVTIDDTTPTQGQTLTASNTLVDADGLGSISYQWQRGGANIAGATGSAYTTTQSDVGAMLRVVASYTDGLGTAESVASADTAAVANVNDTPSGSVTLDDTTPTQGQMLTASNTLADLDGLGTITYQWQRGGVNIAGATGSTYTATQADVGSVLRVVANYTDGLGTAESVASADTAAVANVNDLPTGNVTIDDTTPTQGQTLTASNTLADADGLGSISYQWQRGGANIAGATGSAYTTTQSDVGSVLRVIASYTDTLGTAESVASADSTAVANANDAPTGSVTIDDTTPTQGQTLTASNTLADADGLGSISYQWQRGGANIAGATGATHTTTQADVGSVLRVIASYTDGQGTPQSVASADTAAVTNVNDAPVGVPTIIGVVSEGQTLSADTAGIGDADGLGAFGYQWLSNGAAIGGATASTYTLGDTDVGTLISVRIAYTDGEGTNENLSSAQTAAVAHINNAPVTAPVALAAIAEDGGARVITQAELLLNTTDLDGPSLSATNLAISIGAGTLVDNGDGTWTYTAPLNDDTSVGFAYTVTDGSLSAGGHATLDITPVNDVPTLGAASLTLDGGQGLLLGTAQLRVDDPDSAAASLSFTVSDVRNGRFEWVDTPGASISQFTQADVAAGRVRFVSTSGSEAPAFRVVAFDGQSYSAEISAAFAFNPDALPRVDEPAWDPPAVPGTGGPSDRVAATVPGPAAAPTASAIGPAAPSAIADGGGGLDSAPLGRFEVAAPRSASVTPEAQRVRSNGDGGDLALKTVTTADDYFIGTLQIQALNVSLQGAPSLRAGPPSDGPVDQAQDSDEKSGNLTLSETTQITGLALTAGTVWWALRAGGLLSGLLLSLPAWRHADLLAVLPDDEDEDAWDLAEDDEAERDEHAVGAMFEPALEGDRR